VADRPRKVPTPLIHVNAAGNHLILPPFASARRARDNDCDCEMTLARSKESLSTRSTTKNVSNAVILTSACKQYPGMEQLKLDCLGPITDRFEAWECFARMLCVTCPNRDSGSCGALLEAQSRTANSVQWPSQPLLQVVRPGEQIIAHNEVTQQVLVLCAGWACRYIQLADGRRQILGFLLPGDLFSMLNLFEPRSQFTVAALTGVQVSRFERPGGRARSIMSNRLQLALENACRDEHAGAIRLITVLGKCSAEERIAYLVTHLAQRLRARSVIRGQSYPFPLRLRHIADALGLTPVHVSRVLSHFRDRGLCVVSNGVLNLLDEPALKRLGTVP
jgi:CRP/FNR family transcriptional regulator